MSAKLNPEVRQKRTIVGVSPEADQLVSTRQRVATAFGLDAAAIQVVNPRGEKAKVKDYDPKARRKPVPVKRADVVEINNSQTVLMDGVVDGRTVWLTTIAGMSMGCYEELQKQFSHEIANDAALFYGSLLDSFTLPEDAMTRATYYAQQRYLGLDDTGAKEVVAGKRAPFSAINVSPAHVPMVIEDRTIVVDPEQAVILPVTSHSRLKVAAIILGLGVALAGGVYSVRRLVNNVVSPSSQTQQR